MYEGVNKEIQGYGAEIDTTDDAIVSFVKEHEETIMESTGRFMAERRDDPNYIVEAYNTILEAADKNESVKEALSDYEGCNSTDTGVYSLVADIMWLETGIRFAHHRNMSKHGQITYVEENYIMLDKRMPWDCNDIERNISKDDFNEIMSKYFIELSIRLISSDIKYNVISYEAD